jgi:hypothetical protein
LKAAAMTMRYLLCIFLLLAALSARAAEPAIGYVKTTTGEATVRTGDTLVAALPGTPVYLGSQLHTGAKGSLGVSFQDDTVMAMGPDTELTVDDYLYAPGKGQLRLASTLLRGTLNYLSGVIAKLKPDAVSITTPSGTIGVRGTQFALKVDPAAP